MLTNVAKQGNVGQHRGHTDGPPPSSRLQNELNRSTSPLRVALRGPTEEHKRSEYGLPSQRARWPQSGKSLLPLEILSVILDTFLKA